MNNQDYYKVLGLTKEASASEIKSAYRKLALKHHPDHNPDNQKESENKFKEISEAYGVLGDPEKKSSYDQFGHSPRQGWNIKSDFSAEDMFSWFFSGQKKQQRGTDVRVQVAVSLEEVATGATKEFTFNRRKQCNSCSGLGGEGSTCKTCQGYGHVRQNRGMWQVTTECPKCRGKRIELTSKCSECQGNGYIKESRRIKLNIPVGINSGNILNVKGEGELNTESKIYGNLLCQIQVQPHKIFERHGRDIICEKIISFTQACLGCSIIAPTLLAGKTELLTVPAGTQNGHIFKLDGRGFPRPGSKSRATAGDQYIHIKIDVPKKLSKKTIDLLKELEKDTRNSN